MHQETIYKATFHQQNVIDQYALTVLGPYTHGHRNDSIARSTD